MTMMINGGSLTLPNYWKRDIGKRKVRAFPQPVFDDLLDVLRRRMTRKGKFSGLDEHWNKEGNIREISALVNGVAWERTA
jgi:hypothetical protein